MNGMQPTNGPEQSTRPVTSRGRTICRIEPRAKPCSSSKSPRTRVISATRDIRRPPSPPRLRQRRRGATVRQLACSGGAAPSGHDQSGSRGRRRRRPSPRRLGPTGATPGRNGVTTPPPPLLDQPDGHWNPGGHERPVGNAGIRVTRCIGIKGGAPLCAARHCNPGFPSWRRPFARRPPGRCPSALPGHCP